MTTTHEPARAWNGVDAQPPSRVPYLDPADLDEEHRHLLDRPINLFRGLANSPGALDVHHRFGEWIRWDCELDPRLRQLVILHVGYLAKSPYEYSHHLRLSQQFGVTDDDVDALARLVDADDRSHFTEPELAALDATRELFEDATVADRTWARLTAAFNTRDAANVVVVASFYCYVVRVLSALRLEVEPDWAEPLDRFPLDRS